MKLKHFFFFNCCTVSRGTRRLHKRIAGSACPVSPLVTGCFLPCPLSSGAPFVEARRPGHVCSVGLNKMGPWQVMAARSDQGRGCPLSLSWCRLRGAPGQTPSLPATLAALAAQRRMMGWGELAKQMELST